MSDNCSDPEVDYLARSNAPLAVALSNATVTCGDHFHGVLMDADRRPN